MPSALVIGGRGQCGMAIGRRLADDGWAVTATTSGPTPGPSAVPGVDWIATEGWAEAVDTVDVVVHTTAYTLADADALVALGDRIGSAVVISTLSVYSDDAGHSLDTSDTGGFPEWPVPIPEDWPLVAAGDGGYSARKVAVEARLAARAPWPVTVLRPGAVHGPHSRHLREWYFVKRVLDGRPTVVLPFEGASIFQPTATTNLAELTLLAARRPGHRVLNCGDHDPPTVARISAVVDDLLGATTDRVAVAGPEPAPTVGNTPWSVPRPVVADMRRAETELGYVAPDTYAEALERTIPWAVDACRDRDWRTVFPTLATYPDLFDYDAEDAYLAARR